MMLGTAFAAIQPMRPEAQSVFEAYAASGGQITLF
jgi:hypothetical protein